eukprot:SAG22_NODE_8474_length_653_cov_0.969314_2_plen_68_part_00
MKMGFKGTLGNGQKGLSRPIVVKLRMNGMGLQDEGERTAQARQVGTADTTVMSFAGPPSPFLLSTAA